MEILLQVRSCSHLAQQDIFELKGSHECAIGGNQQQKQTQCPSVTTHQSGKKLVSYYFLQVIDNCL